MDERPKICPFKYHHVISYMNASVQKLAYCQPAISKTRRFLNNTYTSFL